MGHRDGFVGTYKSDSSFKTQLGIRDEQVGRLIVKDQSSLESFVHLRRLTTDYLHRLGIPPLL